MPYMRQGHIVGERDRTMSIEKLAKVWIEKLMRDYNALMDNWERTMNLLKILDNDIWPQVSESLMREQEYGGD